LTVRGLIAVPDTHRYGLISVSPPYAYSVNKFLGLNMIQRQFRSKSAILAELFADSRFQRSCGVFPGGFESLAACRGISLPILY
jgi:hypothetical protein